MTLAEFVRAAGSLKDLKRAGWVDKISMSDGESVADHSYSAAVIGMVLSDAMGLDSERVIKMALLHDLAESRIGDIIPGSMPDDEKYRIENLAFVDIAGLLPEGIRSEYVSIWDEFCAGDTHEARLVRQADKIDMALQAVTYARTKRATRDDVSVFVGAADAAVTDNIARNLLSDIVSRDGCVSEDAGSDNADGDCSTNSNQGA